jgi:hypothetical protein
MSRRIFFRDACATLTSSELIVEKHIYPLAEIQSARGLRRHKLTCWPFRAFALVITTSTGEWEVLRHRNPYVIFQLEKAIGAALREARENLARSA